ncbi:MAG: dockerin type I domain-containing protein, partial [Ruminococcus sp.]
MDIFSKVGAVVTAGTLIFSDIAFNAQYVSAENEVFPETMIIEDYTGYFQRSFNIDIDGDGEKEKIGYYYIGSKYDHYAISDVYYVYNGDSEPYTLYKRISNDHMNYKLHLVKDNNTGETFIGYIYTDMFGSKLLYKFNQNGEDEFVTGYRGELNGTIDDGVSIEEYYAYMDNVTFLDQTAYGKGDVDGDADITLSDVGIMLSCYSGNAAGLPAEINEIQKNAADMDKDGEITINDAAAALSLYSEHAAGIIDTLILPPAVKEDYFYAGEPHVLYSGDLESVFYLDID